jgi:hypothetical protein
VRVIIRAVEQGLQAILFGNYAKYAAHVILRRLKMVCRYGILL